MREILLRAPATIANFGPGFDIFAVALENPFDILRIKRTNNNSIKIKLTGKAEGIPNSPKKKHGGTGGHSFL